ncbi:inositol polyphosphate multikinase-like isoform X2 [Dreissena polymorpha]|nr:inositol polyphosphate multikinase-like isoform X2 [Dreissena polymorpha]
MDYNDTKDKDLHLPKGAAIPRSQVAGHKHEGRSKLGMLEHEDGYILKALQKPPRGTRELHFYEKIYDQTCTDKHVLQLRELMPAFYGAFQFQEYPEVTYLRLENLVSRFRRPCVVDIKMGKKTYDPEAGPAKIAKEMTKFPNVEKFGFQFTGMQTYDPFEERMKFYDKFFCRSLGEDEVVLKGLGTFFNFKHGLRKDAIRVILDKLLEIEHWFVTQKRFSFYASSLLLIYEGDMQQTDYYAQCVSSRGSQHTVSSDPADNVSSEATDSTDITISDTLLSDVDVSSSGQTDNCSLTASSSNVSVNTASTAGSSSIASQGGGLAEVKMIDFTHVFDVNERDDNYLYGLQNLIMYMRQLLTMDS